MMRALLIHLWQGVRAHKITLGRKLLLATVALAVAGLHGLHEFTLPTSY